MIKQKKIILVLFVFLLALLFVWIFSRDIFARKIILKGEISKTKEETASLGTVSFISPHHLVAEKLIEDIFKKTSEINKNSEVKRIILLSPNHQNIGHGWGIVADKDWNMGNEIIKADTKAIDVILRDKKIFLLDNNAFDQEHGIKNLLPYVAKYFPAAKIVPIMLRDELSLEKSEKIAELLANNFRSGTVVALSADFSHYVGKTVSEMHDKKSIATIQNFDFENIPNLDIDCRGGLMIMEKYSQKIGANKFNLLDNSNSSKIYGQYFGNGNTSYITGYFSKEDKQKNQKTTNFIFFGDLMLDRGILTLVQKRGVDWLTEKIQRLFWSQDFNVANLEGPITDNTSISIGLNENEKRYFVFTFSPEITKHFLKGNDISILNIGNNHIGNFKEVGITETKKYLDQIEIDYFGDPLKKEAYLQKEVNDVKIAFVNYNQFGGTNEVVVVKNIQAAKSENNLVILMAHWGTEYALQQNEKQVSLAHTFIDAGADMIIGTHPHVVQPIEIYKNKAIFYSLGNFIFDQYFSENVKTRLAVGVSKNSDEIAFYLISLYLEKSGQLMIMEGEKRKELLERIARDSNVDNSVKSAIIEGEFYLKK